MRFLWALPASLALSFLAIAPSQALTITYTGDLTGKPQFDSPVLPPNPPNSTFGLAFFPYDSQPFYVDTTTNYNFLSTSQAFTTNPLIGSPTPPWKNFTLLYQNTFDPNNPLTNLITANDVNPTFGLSGFNNISLSANTQYFFVTTAYNPDEGYGTFSNNIVTSAGAGAAGTITLGTVVPFEFSPALGLGAIGILIGAKTLRKRIGKKSVR